MDRTDALPSSSHSVTEVHLSNSMPLSGLVPVGRGLRKWGRGGQLQSELVEPQVQQGPVAELQLSCSDLLPPERIWSSFSKLCNCSMKLKLGAIFDFLVLTKLKASLRDIDILYIRYATVMVTDLDTPARQCTRTPFLFIRASSEKKRIEI